MHVVHKLKEAKNAKYKTSGGSLAKPTKSSMSMMLLHLGAGVEKDKDQGTGIEEEVEGGDAETNLPAIFALPVMYGCKLSNRPLENVRDLDVVQEICELLQNEESQERGED